MRLIDLDTLKQNLCGECTMNFPKECRQIGCTKVDKQDILEALRIPVIDIEPVKHGRWKLIRMEDNGDGFYTCSNCDRGDIHSPLVTVPYCWYCGARMDEERKEE